MSIAVDHEDILKEIQRLENFKDSVEKLIADEKAEKEDSARAEALEEHLKDLEKAKRDLDDLIQDQKDVRKDANQSGLSAEPGKAKDMAEQEPAAFDAHGISEEECARFGVVPAVACSLFNQICLQADVIVAHNLSFDASIMKTALHRLGNKPHRLDGRQQVCTKEASTDVLKLPGKYGYKWPTLAEAYLHYTGKELEGAHDALVDTEACLEIFRGLVQEGVVALDGR